MGTLIMSPTKDLTRAHLALRGELNRLERAARTSADVMPLELRNSLEQVRTCLWEHFRCEEENGYMQEVLRQAPHLQRTAEHLLHEHRILAENLDALLNEAAHPQLADPTLRDRVLTWIEQVHAHESCENLLAEEAFNRDNPAED